MKKDDQSHPGRLDPTAIRKITTTQYLYGGSVWLHTKDMKQNAEIIKSIDMFEEQDEPKTPKLPLIAPNGQFICWKAFGGDGVLQVNRELLRLQGEWWITRENEIIHITNLGGRHLVNVYDMLMRDPRVDVHCPLILGLEAEICRRGGNSAANTYIKMRHQRRDVFDRK